MNVRRLVLREILHRKLNFAMGLLSVIVAVACLVGSLTLLRADELRTAQAGLELENTMRKITKGLGFNILILPKDQDLSELHTEGTLSKTMPEEYAERLANSKIVTVNHLLPMLMHKMKWEERNQTIILTGTRGEVPLIHRALKKPIQDQVPPGTMVIGSQVHKHQNLKVGDQVTLLGREFTISKLHPERGTADDSTVWINLREAQELLNQENLVNAILALECNCTAPDRVGQIRQEISAILPGTQVIERGPPALARAEARNKAKQVAVDSLKQHESFAAVLVPLVIVGSAVWIGFLTFSNVRQRHEEIGILRAIGFRSAQILRIFLGKALLVGLLGAAIGYGAGFLLGAAFGDSLSGASLAALFAPEILLLAIVVAPLLSGLASWLPAMMAARKDPAVVLQGE